MPERAEIEAVAQIIEKWCRRDMPTAYDCAHEILDGASETTGYTRVRNDELARLMLADAATSPSRDGTVAVEDWRTIATQLAGLLRELHPQNPYYREKQAEALAAFDALAGESNEGGNQNDERRH